MSRQAVLKSSLATLLGLVSVFFMLWLLDGRPMLVHADGNTYCVHPTGDDVRNCGCTPQGYCRTVHRAVVVASDGDVINVAGGDYSWSAVSTHGTNGMVEINKSVNILGGWNDDFTARDPWTNVSMLDAEGNHRVVYISGDVTPTLDGFYITGGYPGSNEGGGIYAINNAHPIIANSVISGNSAAHGAGIAFNVCTNFKVLTTTICNNIYNVHHHYIRGGGVYLYQADSGVFENVDVISNTISGDVGIEGGGIYLDDSDDVTFRHMVIRGNSAEDGGGVYNYRSSDRMKFENVSIYKNIASYNYGGIYSEDSDFITFSRFTITLNTASNGRGGGVYLSGSPITLSYGLVFSNTSMYERYGGIYLNGNDATLHHVTILSNTADEGCSGLYVQGNNASLSYVIARGNQAGDYYAADYGGIYLASHYATLQHITVDNNYARDDVGGLYMVGNYSTLEYITATNNIAYGFSSDGGMAGGIYLQSTPVTLTHILVAGNKGQGSGSDNNGGGIYVSGANAVLTDVTVISNSTAHYYGGFYLSGDNARLSQVSVMSNTSDYNYSGLYLDGSGAILEDIIAQGNRSPTTTTSYGGGLYLNNFSNGILRRGIIIGNQARSGGGLYVDYGYPNNYRLENLLVAENIVGLDGSGAYFAGGVGELVHHTYARNSGGNGQGLYLDGNFVMTNAIVASHTVGVYVNSGSLDLYYSNFFDNDTSYTPPGSVNPVAGNKGCDPHFVDPAHGDYHLAADPGPLLCVLGQATPTSVRDDFEGDPRPTGSGPDMGCDELYCEIEAALLMEPGTPRASESVTFEAVPLSGDPAFQYQWAFGDGTTATGRVVQHTYSVGNYTAILTAANGCGQEVITRAVQVVPTGTEIGVSGADFVYRPPSPISLTQTVAFTGFVAAGTSPITYTWAFGDGITATGRTVTHTYAREGYYTIRMTATNAVGGALVHSVASHGITVEPPCRLEAPGFALNPPTPHAGTLTWLEGWVITGTPPIDFTWDFGNGETGTGQMVSQTYTLGNAYYTVAMTATNACEQRAVSRTHYVALAGACVAVNGAAIHHEPWLPEAGQGVTLTAYALEGTAPLSYTWTLGDGEVQHGRVITHTYDAVGQYNVQVQIHNACGSDTGSTVIEVVLPEDVWREVALSPDRSRRAEPGDTVVYTHTVRNTGTISDSYRMTANSSQGWTTLLSSDWLTLSEQSQATVMITLSVPTGASRDIVDTLRITATSEADPTVFDTVMDWTVVPPETPQAGVLFAPNYETQTAPARVVTYTHTVNNTGTGTDVYTLLGHSSADWPLEINPLALTLASGAHQEVTVRLTTPADSSGHHDVTVVTVTSTVDPAVSATVHDVTLVPLAEPQPGVMLTPDHYAKRWAGSTLTLSHHLTNTGDGSDYFNVTASARQNWPMTLTPSGLALGQGQGTTVRVSVTIPADAPNEQVEVVTLTATSAISSAVWAQATDVITAATTCTAVQAIDIEGPTTALSGTAITLTAVYTPSNATGVALQWDNGQMGTRATYTWSTPGPQTVAVTATDACGTLITDHYTVTVTDALTPAMTLSKAATDLNGPPLLVGDWIRYHITVTNDSTATMTGVVVTDTMPAGVDFIAATPVYSHSDPLVWAVGTLPPTEVWTAVVTMEVNGTADPIGGNTASVSSDQQDEYETEPTLPPDGGAVGDFLLDVVPHKRIITEGTVATYTLALTGTNGLTQPVTLVLTDLPPGSSVTWGDNPVVPTTTTPYTITTAYGVNSGDYRLTLTGTAGNLHHTVVVTLTVTDYPTDSNSPLAHATKTVYPQSITPGGLLTYTIVLSSSGPGPVLSVTLTDPLPSSVIYQADTLTYTNGFGSEANGTIRWTGDVAVVPQTRITFTARVSPTLSMGTNLVNRVVISDGVTAELITPTVPVTVTPAAVADLTVQKLSSRDPTVAGNLLVYTILVNNNGPDSAEGITLTDILPSEVTLVSIGLSRPATSIQGTCTPQNNTVACELGSLEAGAATTVTIAVIPTVTATTTITNSVTIGSLTRDANPGNNLTSETTQITPEKPGVANLTIVKDDAQDPVVKGNLLLYLLTVRNNGPDTATNVTLVDMLPSNVDYISGTSDGGSCTKTGSTILCDFQDLAYGEDVDAVITVRPTQTGPITNTATVASDEQDATPDDNTDTEGTLVVQDPLPVDVAVTKFDWPDPVVAGNLLVYTITVVNNEAFMATNVRLTDTLPSKANLVSLTASRGNCTEENHTVTCDLDTLTQQTPVTLTLIVMPEAMGPLTNTVTVNSSEVDKDLANNSTTQTTAVTAPSNQADLAVRKTAAANPVAVGNLVAYTLTVRNAGPNPATGVVLVDALPSELDFSSATASQGHCREVGGTILCDVGTLSNQAALTVTIVVIPTEAGTFTNTVTVASNEDDTNTTDNTDTETTTVTTTISAWVDLTVRKDAAPNPTVQGNLLAYTVTITNLGPNPATGVTLADALPSEVKFESATTNYGHCTEAGGTLLCHMGTLPSEAVAEIVIIVRPTQPGVAHNTVTVGSDDQDRNLANNTTTVQTQIDPPAAGEADLAIIKQDTPDPVTVGQRLIYTLTVTNNGPDPAHNVTLADPLPEITDFNTVTSSQGRCAKIGGTLLCRLGALSAGEHLMVTVAVTPTVTGTIHNRAIVAGNESDPDAANDKAVAETSVTAVGDNTQRVYLPLVLKK